MDVLTTTLEGPLFLAWVEALVESNPTLRATVATQGDGDLIVAITVEP